LKGQRSFITSSRPVLQPSIFGTSSSMRNGLKLDKVEDDINAAYDRLQTVTITIQNGKGGKYREVPLNLDARKVLEAYLGNGIDDGMYLFPSQRSPQTSTRAIQLMLNKYRNLTGIEVTPHTLRHTFCHELVVRKVPLDVIARLAGHTKRDGSPNIAMVTRYTLPSEDDLTRAVEKLSWQ